MTARRTLALVRHNNGVADDRNLSCVDKDMLAAINLSPSSAPDLIKGALSEVSQLSPLEQKELLQVIHAQTGMSLKDLKIELSGGSATPDHLTLAKRIVERCYKEDHLFDGIDNSLWAWDANHWRKLTDKYLEANVQEHLEFHLNRVSNSDVTNTTAMIKRLLFRPEHEWNRGGADVINLLNGELHICDGKLELRPHNLKSYFQSVLPVEFNANAEAPRFVQFLSEVFSGDVDAAQKSQCVLELMGYTLVSHCRYETFVVLIGQGANGKSVLLEVLQKMLGRSYSAVQPSEFNNKFQRASIQGKLANIVSELPHGGLLPDDSVKAMVSGEAVTVERKNQDPFEYKPFATLWFGTNHMPHTRDHSAGVFRRARILEFKNCFEGSSRDPYLKDKLMDELSGILKLALEAYLQAVIRGGIIDPPSSVEAKQKWSYNSDQIAQFIEEAVEQVANERIKKATLFERYRQWSYHSGITKPYGKNQFFQRIREKGFPEVKSNGAFYFEGIKPEISTVSM